MEKGSCIVCGAEASSRCSNCRVALYCSKDHQKTDWKEHKMSCRAYKVEENIIVASKNLDAGTIILFEDPLVTGPKQVEADGPAVCLGCCCELMGGGIECPQCRWPMCGRNECWAEGSQHALGECSLLKAAGRSRVVNDLVSLGRTKAIYQGILVLRCVSFRQRDPAKWEQLIKLKNWSSPSLKKGLDNLDKTNLVKLVKQWLKSSKENAIQEELMLEISGTFQVNSFQLPILLNKQYAGLRAVYSLASLIGHSCVPNATHTFTKEGQIVVRASIPISKGTRISLNYKTDPLWSTMKRRLYLEDTKFDLCYCERCKDPTELGSFVSGIYCIRCPYHEGILLCETPLVKYGDWICNKCSCRVSGIFIANIIVDVATDYNIVNRDSIPNCEAFIREKSKILHPHNYMLADIKMTLCRLYGRSEEDNRIGLMNDEDLKKTEAVARELLQIVDIVSPGLSRLRAIILYHLSNVTALLIEREGGYDNKELDPRLKVVHDMLKDAHTFFSWEPEGTEESGLAKTVGDQLKIMEFAVSTLKLEMLALVRKC